MTLISSPRCLEYILWRPSKQEINIYTHRVAADLEPAPLKYSITHHTCLCIYCRQKGCYFLLFLSLNISQFTPGLCTFLPVAIRYSSSSDCFFFSLAFSRNSRLFCRYSAIICGIFRMFSAIIASLHRKDNRNVNSRYA